MVTTFNLILVHIGDEDHATQYKATTAWNRKSGATEHRQPGKGWKERREGKIDGKLLEELGGSVR